MQAVSVSDRRHSPRRVVNRVTKIQFGGNAAPRESFLADVSTGGVQLSVEGFKIPDEFVLLLSGNGLHRECRYRVVWRHGGRIGAKSVGLIRRAGDAEHG